MVYPVSSGASQQIPAANTYQPGGVTNESLKRPDEEKRPDESRARDAEASRSQPSQTRDYDRSYRTASESSRAEDNGAVQTSGSRGSNVNITV